MVQQRYSVVHFFERNEVEIIDTKHIITDECVDRSDMNGEDWDADQEVQVPWPLTKGKNQKRYVARVLRFGADIGGFAPYRKAAEEGKDVPLTGEMTYGRGQRAKQPKRVWESESEQSEAEESDLLISSRQQNKKKKTTRTVVGEDARDQLRAKLDSARETELDKLRREVAVLREENQALRTALKIVNGLPDLLKKMEDLAGDTSKLKSGKDIPLPIPATPIRIPLAPQTPASPTGSSMPIPSRPTSTTRLARTGGVNPKPWPVDEGVWL